MQEKEIDFLNIKLICQASSFVCNALYSCFIESYLVKQY